MKRRVLRRRRAPNGRTKFILFAQYMLNGESPVDAYFLACLDEEECFTQALRDETVPEQTARAEALANDPRVLKITELLKLDPEEMRRRMAPAA